LKQGRTALFLVPEIALTPQIVEQFSGRFAGKFALLHSSLSQGERYDQWWKVKKGEALVVLGARSSVYAPLENIGLIVMDEEHENTYKQDDSPRYHTRDVAKWRACLS
jgi:primosomal protein N' (replication factor Y) (superfamily II helicase)